MTTKEWARQLRQQQDAERDASVESQRTIANREDSIWQELVQELRSGLEGYGPPRWGHHETAPTNHVWWIKLMVDTPNKNTEARGVNLVHERASPEICVSYSGVTGVEAKDFSVQVGILAAGDVGLRLADRDATAPEIAQKILKPFLSV